jgi:hypothetical protein
VSSMFGLFTSIFFWGWALKNVIFRTVSFDGGLLSFLLAALTHYYGLRSVQSHVQFKFDDSVDDTIDNANQKLESIVSGAQWYYSMVFWAHLVVAINYTVGVFIYASVYFKVYCAVFALGWLFSGVWMNRLCKRWCELLSDEVEVNAEMEDDEGEMLKEDKEEP